MLFCCAPEPPCSSGDHIPRAIRDHLYRNCEVLSFPPSCLHFLFPSICFWPTKCVQIEKISHMMRNDPSLKFLEFSGITYTGERAAANDANFVLVLHIWRWVVAFSSFVVFRLFFLGCTLF